MLKILHKGLPYGNLKTFFFSWENVKNPSYRLLLTLAPASATSGSGRSLGTGARGSLSGWWQDLVARACPTPQQEQGAPGAAPVPSTGHFPGDRDLAQKARQGRAADSWRLALLHQLWGRGWQCWGSDMKFWAVGRTGVASWGWHRVLGPGQGGVGSC